MKLQVYISEVKKVRSDSVSVQLQIDLFDQKIDGPALKRAEIFKALTLSPAVLEVPDA